MPYNEINIKKFGMVTLHALAVLLPWATKASA